MTNFVQALIDSTLGDDVLVAKAKVRSQWPGPWTTTTLLDPTESSFSSLFHHSTLLPPVSGKNLSPNEFRQQYIQPSRPVLFHDLMDDWPIMQTNSTQGNTNTTVFFDTNRNNKVRVGNNEDGHDVFILLKDFLRYMTGQNENHPEELQEPQQDQNPMFVFDSTLLNTADNIQDCADTTATTATTATTTSRWYTVPKIFSDDDLLQHFTPEHPRPKYKWLLIGPTRSGSSMHQDPMHTNAWNALVQGYKHWIMFHPDTPKHLVNAMYTLNERSSRYRNGRRAGSGTDKDVYWNDLYGWYRNELSSTKEKVEHYFQQQQQVCDGAKNQKKIARCYECVQQPGEIIFVPSMWHHAVLNVADSVAVTQNFVDRSGLDETYKTMKEEDGRKLRVKLTRCRPDLL